METRWLEDFVSLAQTHSFSRSAKLRHVTQPAFSRRIQSLEAWAGTDLVDRSSYPTRLTPAGQVLLEQALEILQNLQATRSTLRSHVKSVKGVVDFAVPHTLAVSFFPHWMSELRAEFPQLRSRLMAYNVHDAVLRLVEGSCDLLLTYHHPSHPIALDLAHYDMLVLGQEQITAYGRPMSGGKAGWVWGQKQGERLPFLAYASGAYLGLVVESVLKRTDDLSQLDRVYETEMSEGLRAMAIEGQGVAFLPASGVQGELARHRLIAVPGAPVIDLEVRVYRQKPAAHQAKALSSPAHQLWAHLEKSVDVPKPVS
jgi:DNA-binding transcriptional LysR family regulator